MELRDLIKQYREEHGLSQNKFAKLAGLSQATVSYLELGINPNTGEKLVPRLPQIQKLADVFGMTPAELLALTDDIMPEFDRSEYTVNWIMNEATKEDLLKIISAATEALKNK